MSDSHVKNVPYVLALTVVRPNGESTDGHADGFDVLSCVRDRSVNLTHPDVVSVPTQRIPISIGNELEALGTPNGSYGETTLLASDRYSSQDSDGHNPMIYIVESLLSRKMGVADALESGDLEFTAELVGYHHGHARYPAGTGVNHDIDDDEELKMLNLRVEVTRGADLFPDQTVSYKTQNWSRVSEFLEMWDAKDPLIIGLTPEQAFGCCVDGLCIASTYDGLRARGG